MKLLHQKQIQLLNLMSTDYFKSRDNRIDTEYSSITLTFSSFMYLSGGGMAPRLSVSRSPLIDYL
jgi:hypothetical protein